MKGSGEKSPESFFFLFIRVLYVNQAHDDINMKELSELFMNIS